MFPFTTFPHTVIGDTMLFAVEGSWFILAVLFGAALTLGVMWLANRTQPTPDARSWRHLEAARATAGAHRGKHR